MLRLVVRDFAYEWRLSACLILALAAVLTPLLVLFGLKFGVVGTLSARLLEDPRNRELVIVGSGLFGPEWFRELSSWSEIGFLIPRTRSIAATMRLRNPVKRRSRPVVADLIPSATGDPVLEDVIRAPRRVVEVVLSMPCAEALDVSAGATVVGHLDRVRDGRRERVQIELEVIGVLPLRSLQRDAALVSIELLRAAEDYRDGRAVRLFGSDGTSTPDGARIFAGARVYARSIDDVSVLRDRLVAQGLEVRTAAAEIERLHSLDRNLSLVFWIVATIAMGGYVLSLAANLWASVDRKQRELSVLRLLGFPALSVVLFPVLGAGLVAVLGTLLASAMYFPAQSGINTLFAANLETGEYIARIMPRHIVVATGGTLLCALAAAGFAGYRASRIQPSEGLRDL